MSRNPTVSVIVPCYNQGRFLREAIRSLHEQTLADWECIIVDDGSKDNTLATAQSLAAEDERIRVIHQENLGLSGARNRGLEQIRGRYVQFLDADDYLGKDKLSKQLDQLAQASTLAVAYCETLQFRDTPEQRTFMPIRTLKLSESDPVLDLAALWQIEGVIPVHAFLFDARFFTEHKIRFDDSQKNTEDWDCWMRLFELRPKLFYSDEPLAFYRLHPDSMCWNQGALRRGRYAAIQKHLARTSNNPRLHESLRRRVRQLYDKERAIAFGREAAAALGLPRTELLQKRPLIWKMIRYFGAARGFSICWLSQFNPSQIARLEGKWRGYEILGFNLETLRLAGERRLISRPESL